MSKAILACYKPRFVADILNWKKTVDLRKSTPNEWLDYSFGLTEEQPQIDVYMYCTKSRKSSLSYSKRYGAHENIVGGKCMYSEIGDGCGKVVGKYTLKKVTSVREFMEFSYLNGEKIGGWEAVLLNNRHEIVLTEKELVEATCMSVDEIRKYDKGNNWLSGWFISNVVAFDNPKELIEFRTGPYPEDVVVRAPMSWMYIEA